MIKTSERNPALDNVKDFGLGMATGLTDEAAMAAAKKTGLVAVQNVAKNVKPSFNAGAMIVGLAANPLINEAEGHLRGRKGMYQNRAQDVFKNIQAIQQLIPNDNKINMLIQQLQQTIQQGNQLFQKKASYNNKNTRLAVIGEFNTGQYARDALIGAGTGAMVGAAAGGVGAIPGAFIGAIGSGLGSGIMDIAYQFKNNYQKASWQAGEMIDKLYSMNQQIQPFAPQLANMLMKLAQDIKNEIEVRFEKKSGASYRNDYDQTAQQGQKGQQGQEGQQGGMSQSDGSSLDPNLSQAVNSALQIYSQAKQAYYMNPQMYDQLRMQYQQMLQEINAYIAQNYPGQDANQILASYMQQANFGMQDQPMMQQPMQQQPMMQQPMMQQPMQQQGYYQPGTFQQGYMQQPMQQQPMMQQPMMQQPMQQQPMMQQPMMQQPMMQQPYNQQMFMQQQPQTNYLR
jgi:hypothetical protein